MSRVGFLLLAAMVNLLSAKVALAAEMIKKNKSMVFLNAKMSELAELEEGDTFYLIDSEDDFYELKVEKIVGQKLAASGEIGDLRTGLAYKLTHDKPDTDSSALEEEETESESDNSIRFELLGGRRWIKFQDANSSEDIRELQATYQFARWPLAFGLFYNQFERALSDIGDLKVQVNSLKGSEYGLRLELNHYYKGLMPFVGVRSSIEKQYSGQFMANTRRDGVVVTADLDLKEKYNAAQDMDFGVRYLGETFGLSFSARKAVKQKLDLKSKLDVRTSGAAGLQSETTKVEGKTKIEFDEFLFGLNLNLK